MSMSDGVSPLHRGGGAGSAPSKSATDDILPGVPSDAPGEQPSRIPKRISVTLRQPFLGVFSLRYLKTLLFPRD